MAMRPRTYRDLAAQVAAVRQIAMKVPLRVHHDLTAEDSPRSGECGASCAQASDFNFGEQVARRLLYDQVEFDARVAWARSQRADVGSGILSELDRARGLGPLRLRSAGGSSKEMDRLREAFPTFTAVLDFLCGRVLLGNMVRPPAVRIPPLLLHGPPGTGKTAFSNRLARWLNVPVLEVNVATLETSFRLTGLDAGYSTGKPGLVWQALQGKSMSPVIVLDELDKRPGSTRDSGLAFLLGLLEPTSATRFQDAYVGLPVDASQITWIATCNDVQSIESPLRSRFRIFDIAEPSHEQMAAVIVSVFKSLREGEPWGRVFPEILPYEVVDQLLDSTPRQVWQALEDACSRAAAAGRRRLVAEDVVPIAKTAPRSIGFLGNTGPELRNDERHP
jgi:hypothetical protein